MSRSDDDLGPLPGSRREARERAFHLLYESEMKGEGPGDVLASRVIALMKATGMPNGLSTLGFGEGDLDALATGAEPQYRVIKNAPVDIGRDELRTLFRSALRYW